MSLHRLGSGDGLQSIGDLYGVHKSTSSNILRESYKVDRKHLQHVFVQTLDESQFRVLAIRIEQLHGISYFTGAINCSHILVLALVVGKTNHYGRKSFHSTI